MNMSSTSMSGMSMAPTSSASSAMASSTSGMSMSHDHSSMDMDMSCSMNMLTNWETIGSCFLTSSWRITTEAQFAGTCVGVFLIVVIIEAIRRWGREWDRYILRRALAKRQAREAALASGINHPASRSLDSSRSTDDKGLEDQAEPQRRRDFDGPAGAAALESLERVFYGLPRGAVVNGPTYFRPTIVQQGVRSIVYAVQFTGAYIIMLIAMSFNAYILISIALGSLVGHFVSTWDNLTFEMDDGSSAPIAGGAGGAASGVGAATLGASHAASKPEATQPNIGSCGTAYEGNGPCCG